MVKILMDNYGCNKCNKCEWNKCNKMYFKINKKFNITKHLVKVKKA